MIQTTFIPSSGIDPNLKNHDGLTALHQCCIDGTVDTVALLLKYGADVNITDRDMWTPLHAAATCGHFKVVTTLVKAGADVTAVNGDGDMPHDITEEEVTLQYLRNEMMKRNISPDEVEQIRSRPHDLLLRGVESVLSEGGDLDQAVGQGGETFLHVAIAERYNDVMKLLVDNGASVTVKDGDGWQPVHVAAYWANEEALDILADDPKVNMRAQTNEGETPYELCDDPNLKLDILHILKDRQDSINNGHTSEGDDILFNLDGTHNEDAMDTSLPQTTTDDDWSNPALEDAPPTLPINIEATELHSDRRNSIKDVKHNAPLKRQSSDRSSNADRHAAAIEAITLSLLQRRGSKENSNTPLIHSQSPDSYRQFYEMVHPTPETPEPATESEVPYVHASHLTPQSAHITTHTPGTTTDTTNPDHSPHTPTPDTPKAATATITKESGVATTSVQGGKWEMLREGVMLRPKKKNAAPPPPRGSLQDLKRQRQEEREHKLEQGINDTAENLAYSTFYEGNGRAYEAPSSPSMIRYRYKMAPDDDIKKTIIREKKCVIM